MAGCCGHDDFGRELRSALEAAGVDITAVRVLAGVPSGLALITVDATGENSITVAPGANGLAGPPERPHRSRRARRPVTPDPLHGDPGSGPGGALDRARAARAPTRRHLAPASPDAACLLAAVAVLGSSSCGSGGDPGPACG